MWRFLVKRLALLVVTLLGICVVSFLIMTQSPGDPTASMLGLQGEGKGKRIASLDLVIENARKALYLDRPAAFNARPNSRSRVAHDLGQDLVAGTPTKRTAAQAELTGEVGTAALEQLVADAPATADKASTEIGSLHALAASLDAQATASPAEVDRALETVEARFPGKGPRFSKRASSAERVRGWAAFVREREAEATTGITAYFDALDVL
ncbi:MAG TPA: hypothetical protein VFF73_10385, partial [Planctomycetota bacterium]|nr:hypothetical protein [Planctomycetota bacterium]